MGRLYTLKWLGDRLELLNQTLLPNEIKYETFDTVAGIWDAIQVMKVRGAPAIGVTAAYAMAISAQRAPKESFETFWAQLKKDADYLASSRPTAVNLFWALERMQQKAQEMKTQPPEKIAAALEREARAIHREDEQTNRAIGENLLSLLADGCTVLTHCNAGILATSAYGTALSPFYLAKERGMDIKVFADETRPRMQGSRLTVLELMEAGVDVTLICDDMAAVVMSEGRIDAVITGCDRVAANGDTANKIGTLGVSILARHFGIPMYIAAPTTTIDMNCPDGSGIPIEERDSKEITCRFGVWTAPRDAKTYNPAFDVTPAAHISAIVTEKGIVYPPYGENLKKLLG